MTGQLKPSAVSFRVVCRGPEGAIRLSPGVYSDYAQAIAGNDDISVKRKTHLDRYFKEFCATRQPRLSHEKFKKEGNFSDGKGKNIAIWTFKSWQFRIYGAVMTIAGERCFVGVRADLDKKQNRADRQLLCKAALDIAKLAEYRG